MINIRHFWSEWSRWRSLPRSKNATRHHAAGDYSWTLTWIVKRVELSRTSAAMAGISYSWLRASSGYFWNSYRQFVPILSPQRCYVLRRVGISSHEELELADSTSWDKPTSRLICQIELRCNPANATCTSHIVDPNKKNDVNRQSVWWNDTAFRFWSAIYACSIFLTFARKSIRPSSCNVLNILMAFTYFVHIVLPYAT